jgi:hypothetical protein
MRDGMKIDRRLVLLGVMLIVLSMTMATQYATTKIGYTYSIVHPSNADIRFIGCDNATDGIMILRVDGTNASGQRNMKLVLGGNWTENQNKTYTAAFGIVNEENFNLSITYINVSATAGADYMQIWLHSDRDTLVGSDAGTKVMVWNKGTLGFSASSCVWKLGEGNFNAANMCADGAGTQISTPWNEAAHMRNSYSNTNAVNGTSDFVWVQISLNIPDGALSGTNTGTIYINFKATQ